MVIAVAVCAVACKTAKPAVAATPVATAVPARAGADTPVVVNAMYGSRRNSKVLGVLLTATDQGNDGKMSFALKEVIIKDGYYKHSGADAAPGYLKAVFADDKGARLDSSYFENPLHARVEYEKEDGKLTTGTIVKKQESAYVRANYSPAITMLHIYSADNKLLETIKLTNPEK